MAEIIFLHNFDFVLMKKDMIDFKRPGTGIPPEGMMYLIGKVAKRDITFDEIILLEDF